MACSSDDTDECYECESGFFILLNSCYEVCPSGFYQDDGLNGCVSCNEKCSTCTGDGPENC